MADSAKNKAIHAKSRGNYSIFKNEGGDATKSSHVKKGLSHSEMHHELKTNPAYRGDKDSFSGGRTYKRK